MKINAYLATHFFSESGYEWTMKLSKLIRESIPEINLYSPVENGEINDKSGDDSHIDDISIADGDCFYLDGTNILIANLDGVEIDSGVSAEVGYMSGLIKAEALHCVNPKIRYIIGLYTDIRQNGSGDNRFYINLFTKGLTRKNGHIVSSTKDLVEWLKHIEKEIKFDFENGGIL